MANYVSVGDLANLGTTIMPDFDLLTAAEGKAMVAEWVVSGALKPADAFDLNMFFDSLPMARMDWQREKLRVAWSKHEEILRKRAEAGVEEPLPRVPPPVVAKKTNWLLIGGVGAGVLALLGGLLAFGRSTK